MPISPMTPESDHLDLSRYAVAAHWASIDPELGSLVRSLDQAEDWVLDRRSEIARRVLQLGHRLCGPEAARGLASASVPDILLVLALISASRSFRLLQWLDDNGGHGTALVGRLASAEGLALVQAVVPLEPLREIVLHRLRVIENAQFLARLFDPARLGRLRAAILESSPVA